MKKSEFYRSCHMADCNYGHEHVPSQDGHIFTCRACHSAYCTSCEVPMHTDETCREYQAAADIKNKEQQATTEYLNETSQKCPGCTMHISKIGGCNHMTCTYVRDLSLRERVGWLTALHRSALPA